jgi:hypothetical protein
MKIKCTNCTVKNVAVFNAIGQPVLDVKSTQTIDFQWFTADTFIVRVETEAGDKFLKKLCGCNLSRNLR